MSLPVLPPPPARWRPAGRRAAVSLGDLLRVAGTLEADDATLARAAVLLGLAAPPVPPLAVRPPVPDLSVPPVPAADRGPASRDDPAVRPAGTDDPRPVRRPRLVVEQPSPAAPPRALPASVEQLLPAPPATAPPPPEPLLSPAHQRAVLTALVAVPRPGREVDVAALVERLAGRQPVHAVPRLAEATTRLGVQLLVDHGPSMGPYLRDLRLLTAALRQVAGADGVRVLATDGDPATVLPLALTSDEEDEDWEERPYEPPGGGRPVLVASDLGIAGAAAGSVAGPAAWLRLADRAREAGSPLVVLVPYPPARWPAWAAGRLTLVRWDRPTDAGQARRAARRALALAGVRP
jgi:hypothetical protein